ncbi:hypothetical protein D3C71_24720 [compost metagenome]
MQEPTSGNDSTRVPADPDPRDFETFTEVCKGLPGVKPRLTRAWLKDVYLDALQKGDAHAHLEGLAVPVAELAELFCETERGDYPVELVSPAGARLLVRLYAAGVLETAKGSLGEPSAELQAYSTSEPVLLEKARARAQLQAEHHARLDDPANIQESEFSHGLLDELFWRHNGKGDGALRVGGILVQKSLSRFVSNSGKSSEFRVVFSWTSPSGERKELAKPSQFEGNRRNDAERNWGLPE